ncbi:MAG: FMN-binding negative transcriptional regulator [Acidisphaera sp.]|nr:FMN-binding negative transcriptional regulator [Acidisphaera sp.]
MYQRPVFNETDTGRIIALMRAHPFGLLVTAMPGLTASPIPFTVVETAEGFVLTGHLAAGNPQCAALSGEGMAVFSGPHAYISPGWYRSGPAVPTWDYAAVHVIGRLQPIAGTEEIAASLRALGTAFDPTGFDLDALPPDFRTRMMAGIRAFTLIPERVEAQWKMSQNRSAADRQGVVAALRAQGEGEVADLVEQTLT